MKRPPFTSIKPGPVRVPKLTSRTRGRLDPTTRREVLIELAHSRRTPDRDRTELLALLVAYPTIRRFVFRGLR